MTSPHLKRRPQPFPRERFLAFIGQLKIVSKDEGMVPFKLKRSQLYVLNEICAAIDEGQTTIVILKPRQVGMSTFFIALDMFWAWEHPGLSGAFATHTEQSRDYFRNVIKTFSDHLPATHRVDMARENRMMVTFCEPRKGAGNSVFSYLVAGVKEKSGGGTLGRSGAYNYCHATEVAFWGSPDDLDELRATFSERYPHRLYVYESTANGFNHFADMWDAAKESPVQKATFVGWWQDDYNEFDRDDPIYKFYMPQGEDEPWLKEEKRRAKLVLQTYGWTVTDQQLAWYRWALIEKCGGRQESMDEKYPWTEDDAFVATGSKFFKAGPLTDAMRRARGIPFLPFRYSLGMKWDQTEIISGTARNHDLKVWEEPTAYGSYAIGCDPAYGSSDESDRCVISVWRCFADRIVQCAEYVSPTTSTHECAWIVAHLSGYYGVTMPIIEVSGPGMQVFEELRRLQIEAANSRVADMRKTLQHMRHFLYRRGDSVMGTGVSYNWKMSRDTKWKCMTGLSDALETREAVFNSVPLLDEMRTVSIKDGVIEAIGRGKDDRVVGAALAIQAWKSWERPRLINMGMTFDAAFKEPEHKGAVAEQAVGNVIDYLKQINIKL